jgi:hypothetical protein
MPLPVEDLRSAALAQLTDRERHSCIVYLASQPITPGERLSFPRLTLECPWDAYLMFADLDPSANWGHACCYICIGSETGQRLRVDAQLPPFGPSHARSSPRQWRVIYRTPGVPEALLAIPEK